MAWNCWGLGNPPTIRALKTFLRGIDPSILFLFETKMSEKVSLQRISQFAFQNHCIVASMRRSGGLWLLSKDDLNIEIVSQTFNLIHATVQGGDGRGSWHLFCLYGPLIASHRSNFWKNMTSYAQQFNGPKCFIGDFNSIVSNEEKCGGLPVLNSNISCFNDFIQMNHLIDLGYKGPAYTWTNGREIKGLIRQRLDRVLANPEWNIARAPPNYKFEAHWLSHPEFLQKVEECWSYDNDANIQSKLRILGSFLIEWSRRRIGCIKRKISVLKTKLLIIQSWRPSDANIQKEKLAMAHLNEYLIMKDAYWDQRMKQRWAKSGDRNTGHFHLSIQHRRRKNKISHLLKNDQTWTSDQSEISRELIQHFKSINQESSTTDPPQFSIQGQAVSNLDNDELCRIPSIDEI
ncbi:uncharacterized protein LOC113290621 [Papaver somniferum]|uniref:uncharacterized protein LOC113290621 n=1 Tax=Papaver somniferum TaxID=3469 RepID=UPI000E6FF1BA|nr:uncharacterized protein LOC113290621 [Papaver somniferum]